MKNKKLITGLVVLVLITFAVVVTMSIRNKNNPKGIEEQFTQSIVQGNCSRAHSLLSSKKAQKFSSEDFQEKFCKVLLGKKLSKVHETGDIDADADIEYTSAYEINPAPANGKYLLVSSLYFYESETIEDIQFSSNIDNLLKR